MFDNMKEKERKWSICGWVATHVFIVVFFIGVIILKKYTSLSKVTIFSLSYLFQPIILSLMFWAFISGYKSVVLQNGVTEYAFSDILKGYIIHASKYLIFIIVVVCACIVFEKFGGKKSVGMAYVVPLLFSLNVCKNAYKKGIEYAEK